MMTLAAGTEVAGTLAVAVDRAIAIRLMSTVPTRAVSTKAVLAKLAWAGAGGTTHREVGFPSLRGIVVQPRQRRTNQGTVHGTIHVVDGYRDRRRDLGRLLGYHFGFSLDHEAGVVRVVRRGIQAWRGDFAGHAGEHLLIEGAGDFLLAALWRHLRLLELVITVTSGASGLAHFVADHRDDGMIGDSALARTVVVDYVAETRLALLHQAP